MTSVAFVLCMGLLGQGCILFINDDASTYGGTCHFASETTACGQCIKAHCQGSVDSCCGTSSCKSYLGYLDGCAGGDTTSCSLLYISPLYGCVSASCAEPVCAGVPGTGQPPPGNDGGPSGDAGADAGPRYRTDCFSAGSECLCSVDGAPNSFTCDPTHGVPGAAVCCQDYGWPRQSTFCSCQAYSCTPTSYGGTCSLGATYTGTTSWTSGAGVCCASAGGNCTCDDNASTCGSDMLVAQCDITSAQCATGKTQVTACSQ